MQKDKSFTECHEWGAIALPVTCPCCNKTTWFDDTNIPNGEKYEILCDNCKGSIIRKNNLKSTLNTRVDFFIDFNKKKTQFIKSSLDILYFCLLFLSGQDTNTAYAVSLICFLREPRHK